VLCIFTNFVEDFLRQLHDVVQRNIPSRQNKAQFKLTECLIQCRVLLQYFLQHSERHFHHDGVLNESKEDQTWGFYKESSIVYYTAPEHSLNHKFLTIQLDVNLNQAFLNQEKTCGIITWFLQ
jgi:hypothetical protein